MPTKKELLVSLSSKGIPHDVSMKKDALERRLQASQYTPSSMNREAIEKLTVPVLKEILSLHGESSKGLTKKEDVVNAVIQLNTTIAQQEQQQQVETTEKLKKVPTDALRLAMKRLTLPEQMKASIAFSEKGLVQELQAKRLDIPTKLTIYDDHAYERVIRIQRFTEMTKEQIKTNLYPLLRERYTWTLENDYLTVKRFFVNELTDDENRIRFIIQPKNAPISIVISHVLQVGNTYLQDKIYNLQYYVSFDTTDREKLQDAMNYVRIAIRWIEHYTGFTIVSKNQRKDPLEIILNDVPRELLSNPMEKSKYLKMITQEIKRVIKK